MDIELCLNEGSNNYVSSACILIAITRFEQYMIVVMHDIVGYQPVTGVILKVNNLATMTNNPQSFQKESAWELKGA